MDHKEYTRLVLTVLVSCSFSIGYVHGAISSNFENNNTCGFSFGDHWRIHNGTFTYRGVAKLILGGHKKGSSSMFAVFDAPDNKPTVSTHNLESPLINPGSYSFTFWYIMPSMNSRLHVYLRDSNSNVTIFDYTGQVPDWTWENNTISPKEITTVIFEATWAKRGFVGIDDISVTDKASDNTNTLNTTISTPHRITMAPGRISFSKPTLASFQLENPLIKNCSTFRLYKQPCMHDNTRGRLPHRNVTTFYL